MGHFGWWCCGPSYQALPGRPDYPALRFDVWIPILLANYPGYTLRDLLACSLSEIEFLIQGLDHIAKWKLLQEPLLGKKERNRLKLPPFLDHCYPTREKKR
ncbi:MAG: hypothetical protein ABC596_05765 [Candidatus Methanosuratincola petrocarbonis]